jgi:hypothetical protein
MPRRKTGIICRFPGMGSLPSILYVKSTRKIEAIKNLKKAAENGPTSTATTRPAIKVPPHNSAVNRSFI